MPKQLVFSLSILLMVFCSVKGQILNREVKAIIELKKSEDLFNVVVKAENMSSIEQSLTYELTMFKEDIVSKNKGVNKQSGRFVIASKTINKLTETTLSTTEQDRVVLLLLIRNLDKEIIGKDRKVIFKNKIQEEEYDNKVTLKKKPADGIRLRGVVLERVKTKPGRDFYNFFYSKFLTYNFKDSRPILIEEIHDRGRNTKIFIKIDNIKVYEFFVQPKTDYLKGNVDVAMKVIYQYFEKKEKDYIVKY